MRNQKAAEETYLASLRKQSDARLSEALDRSRIMNVAIAEAATVPVLPATPPLLRLAVGFILALLVALGHGICRRLLGPIFPHAFGSRRCSWHSGACRNSAKESRLPPEWLRSKHSDAFSLTTQMNHAIAQPQAAASRRKVQAGALSEVARDQA